MVESFKAEINKIYFVETYSLFLINSGTGTIEVDFQNYSNWQDKAIYLEKGQYIKFLSEDFEVIQLQFPQEHIYHSEDVRVLFKHLISLGYIDLNECQKCQQFLKDSIFSGNLDKILDISKDQWFWQNPFRAQKAEYQVIFDLKDIIDLEYPHEFNSARLTTVLHTKGVNVNHLVRSKLGLTVSSLLANKRALESKRGIAFTDKSIQEIAYETGFKDPSYFNRAFKAKTGQTPAEFRKNFDFAERETFVQNVMELLQTHFREERQIGFYAAKMNMSVQTLSKKIKNKLNVSLGQLIRYEVLNAAKHMLKYERLSVKETAFQLGYEEANHFSIFFKHYTGKTPSQFQR